MIVLFIKRAVLIAVVAAACYGLAERFESVNAAIIWAGTAALASGLGAALLRTSAIGRVTWRNMAAVGLFSAWVVDAAALMYVAGSIRQATPGSRAGSLWKLAGAIAVVICVSAGLYIAGRPEAALLVGGGPPAVIGAGAGFVMLIFITVGRNARWN